METRPEMKRLKTICIHNRWAEPIVVTARQPRLCVHQQPPGWARGDEMEKTEPREEKSERCHEGEHERREIFGKSKRTGEELGTYLASASL